MPTNAEWRERLLRLRNELQAIDETTSESRRAVELDQAKVGRLSRMDAIQGQAMNKAIAARRQQALSRIEAALRRLEDGEFGYCMDCGEEIPARRLELDPATALCTGCAA